MRHIFILFILLFPIILSAQNEGTPEIIRGSDQFTLLVKTQNIQTGETIDGTSVYLYSTKSDDLLKTGVTKNGLISFEIDPLTEYEIRTCNTSFFKNGFSLYECNEGNEILCASGATNYAFVAGGGKDKPKAVLKVTLDLSPMTVGSIMELENVYYDLDKAFLRPSAKEELDELAQIMMRNKSITIELSSHTDSRASDQYNNELSQRRADSCFNYLKSKGINEKRIKPKGYGESKLINECSDGVDCTEVQHQKNRRTEIEILTYEPISCQPSLDVDFAIKDLVPDSDDK